MPAGRATAAHRLIGMPRLGYVSNTPDFCQAPLAIRLAPASSIGIRIFLASARSNPVGRARTLVLFRRCPFGPSATPTIPSVPGDTAGRARNERLRRWQGADFGPVAPPWSRGGSAATPNSNESIVERNAFR